MGHTFSSINKLSLLKLDLSVYAEKHDLGFFKGE